MSDYKFGGESIICNTCPLWIFVALANKGKGREKGFYTNLHAILSLFKILGSVKKISAI